MEQNLNAQNKNKPLIGAIALMFFSPIIWIIANLFGAKIYDGRFYYLWAVVLLVITFCVPLIFYKKSTKTDKSFSFSKALPLILLLCLLAWATISVFFAKNITYALFDMIDENFRFEGLLMYYVYAVIFVCAFKIKNENPRQFLLNFFIYVSLAISVFMFIESSFFGLGMRMIKWGYTLPWSNPNHSGYFLAMAIGASASNFVFNKNVGQKNISLITFFMCNLVLVLNDSFGSQLASLCAVIIVSIIALIKDKKLYKTLITLLCVFIASTAVGALLQIYLLKSKSTIFDNYMSLFQDIFNIATAPTSQKSYSAGNLRWELWLETFKNMRDYPIFGIGINCQMVENPGLSSSRPHNEILQIGSTMGIPAMLFYVGALIAVFVVAIKQFKKLSPTTISFLIIACTYVITSFFGVSLPYTFTFYIAFLGLALAGLDYKKQPKSPAPQLDLPAEQLEQPAGHSKNEK